MLGETSYSALLSTRSKDEYKPGTRCKNGAEHGLYCVERHTSMLTLEGYVVSPGSCVPGLCEFIALNSVVSQDIVKLGFSFRFPYFHQIVQIESYIQCRP